MLIIAFFLIFTFIWNYAVSIESFKLSLFTRIDSSLQRTYGSLLWTRVLPKGPWLYQKSH